MMQRARALPTVFHTSSRTQGSLAANIFDWGAKACVDLYQNATILEMYRQVETLAMWGELKHGDVGVDAGMYAGRAHAVWWHRRDSGCLVQL